MKALEEFLTTITGNVSKPAREQVIAGNMRIIIEYTPAYPDRQVYAYRCHYFLNVKGTGHLLLLMENYYEVFLGQGRDILDYIIQGSAIKRVVSAIIPDMLLPIDPNLPLSEFETILTGNALLDLYKLNPECLSGA